MRFTLVIPIYYPGETWDRCVESIEKQALRPEKVLVLDSGSTNHEVAKAESAAFKVISIPQGTFDHGRTRNIVLQEPGVSEFVVYLTQDAVLVDKHALDHILAPFRDQAVAAVCGRQLPRLQAGPIESHARLFTYKNESFTRSMEDKNKFGLKTAFLSNSFAAYRTKVLMEIHGFPSNVIFGEDMYVAAKLLKAGYKIAYASDACVYHSHNYSITQELKRYFDMGIFHARETWIREEFGRAEREGVKFVVSEIKHLIKHSYSKIPEALLRTCLRYSGFRLGLHERYIPLKIKRKMSMNPGFFRTN